MSPNQKHLDSVAPAKTTTRMMIAPSPGPTATIEIVVDGKWQPGWPMTIRKGDRLIVSMGNGSLVLVDLERPCEVAMTPADRDFFVSGEVIRPIPPTQEETTMAFKFDFTQTGTGKDPADIREIVEAAMRGLNRKLKALGATIKLTATFDGKTKGEG